jgi:hypothetical protein
LTEHRDESFDGSRRALIKLRERRSGSGSTRVRFIRELAPPVLGVEHPTAK